jgi:hypothetical protein
VYYYFFFVVFFAAFLAGFFALAFAAMALITSFQSLNVVAANFRVNVFLSSQPLFHLPPGGELRAILPILVWLVSAQSAGKMSRQFCLKGKYACFAETSRRFDHP